MSAASDLDLAFDKFEGGDLHGALQICGAILNREPDNYGALYLSGSVLAALGRNREAIAPLQRATHLAPDKKPAWFNLAKVHTDLRAFESALVAIRHYLQLDSRDAEALALLGTILLEMSDHAEAEIALNQALALAPDLAEIWYNRGNLFKAQAKFDEAIADFRKAVSLDPAKANFHINLGVALHATGRFAEADLAYEAALALDPQSADAWSNRGITLHFLERFDAAIASFDRALSIAPDHSEARVNRAYTKLLLGDFAAGWDDYEARLKSRDYARIALGSEARMAELIRMAPRMEDVAGRHVWLFGEQGAGDIIMFASMIDDLVQIAAKVSLVVDARLCALMRDSFPALEVIPTQDLSVAQISRSAVCLLIGSLGSLFRRKAQDFPQRPYLKADPNKTEKFRHRIAAQGRKRIGISWAGGLAHTRRAARSLALEDLLGLLGSRDDLALVSLQHGQNVSEIHRVTEKLGTDVQIMGAEETYDFSDLSALVASLDAVVTVQNTNVHVCGALGVPCLAILPSVPEWRYALRGEHMPWYGSVRLLRRTAQGNLATILPNVQAWLGEKLGFCG